MLRQQIKVLIQVASPIKGFFRGGGEGGGHQPHRTACLSFADSYAEVTEKYAPPYLFPFPGFELKEM